MKAALQHLNCQLCGTRIPPGGVFYVCRTEIISGSDSILPDWDEASEKIIEKALHELAEQQSEQELMDGVYQNIKLIICGRCRLPFRDKILDMIKY